jgi:hypothetical protein
MNRLFTFGCSYTSYVWRTWADALSDQAQEFQNWGRMGAGNHYIFNSVLECHQRNQFRADDTVIVCWTNTAREDRYVNQNWVTPGNVYTQGTYSQDWVKHWIDERGCLIRDLAFVSAVKTLLEHTGVTWHFLSMVPMHQNEQYKGRDRDLDPVYDVLTVYKDTIASINPSFQEVVHDRVVTKYDQHHTPVEHLRYLERVLPQYPVGDSVRLQMEQEDVTIRNGTYNPHNYPNTGIKRL